MISLVAFTVTLFLVSLAGFWYFAGFQYAVLFCVSVFIGWLLLVCWDLTAYFMDGKA